MPIHELNRPSLPDDRGKINYWLWFHRVLGWDAALPVLISIGSLLIASALQNKPPADVLALVGLPVLAFTVRLCVGGYQIRSNACGPVLRRFQLVALLIALFVLAFADFFIALVAFVPRGNGPQGADMLPVYGVTLLVYATLVAFAMYPGRQRTAGQTVQL